MIPYNEIVKKIVVEEEINDLQPMEYGFGLRVYKIMLEEFNKQLQSDIKECKEKPI